MKRNTQRAKRVLLKLMLLLCLVSAGTAMAETRVSSSSDQVKTGEFVDFRVETDLKDVSTCAYTLKRGQKTVFKGDPEKMFNASYRAQEEGEYTLCVTVKAKGKGKKGAEETAECSFTVRGKAEPDRPGEDGLLLYSQKDGTWKDTRYRSSTLEKSGCAIFALSHALQLMGFEEEKTSPAVLAKDYAKCLVDGGTNNGKLITLAGGDFGFITEQELISDQKKIRSLLADGCMFSFSVANGHIALISGISEDGTKAAIVDSAPTATIERIKKGYLYQKDENGEYQKIEDLAEVSGSRWFFETSGYGGLRYWMDLSYVARRGVRLIRPAWVFQGNGNLADGGEPVIVKAWGSALCTVVSGEEEIQVPTASLWWAHDTADLKVACVTNKNSAWLMNSEGKKIKKVSSAEMFPVTREEKGAVWVRYEDTLYRIAKKEIELLDVPEETKTATVSLNGKTTGSAVINTRQTASPKSRMMVKLKIGTRVAVTAENGDYCRIEAKGLSVWIKRDCLLLD